MYLSKKEVRNKLGLKRDYFAKCMNIHWYNELAELGYKKTDHLLSPSVVRKIYEITGYEENPPLG